MNNILPFPPLPKRIPWGQFYTVPEPEMHVDVREKFAATVVKYWREFNAPKPEWMPLLSDHNDPERSGR